MLVACVTLRRNLIGLGTPRSPSRDGAHGASLVTGPMAPTCDQKGMNDIERRACSSKSLDANCASRLESNL